MYQAIVAAINVKMGANAELEQQLVAADGEQEPERKRLKKVDFRYTTYVLTGDWDECCLVAHASRVTCAV